jgi:preprotein translocase subunit SecD
MSGPGSTNEFAKKAKKAKIPLQMDNKDYGKKSKAVARTYDIIAQGDGHKFYGTRTIMTREGQTFIQELLAEASKEDISTLPEKVIKELRGLVRKGAADLEQKWKDALELVNKAYEVSSVRLPAPDQKGAWKQYMDMIGFGESAILEAVQQQADKPRHIGSHRYFVRIVGAEAQEIDADNMDQIIEMITNKINRSSEVIGTKVRVEERTKEMTKLVVYVNDVKREEIVIQDLS